MVRLVDALLADAVKRRSSDIHLEPEDGFIRVRYRIDGVLRQVSTVHKKFWAAIAVRLKVMSGMDITETRAPQDGRISLTVGGRTRRLPRRHPAHDPRREHRAPHPRPAVRHRAAGQAGPARRPADAAEDAHGAARGRDPRDRPDRQRQDDHALLDPQLPQRRVGQHHDARGSGGVPVPDDPADLARRGASSWTSRAASAR